MRLVPVPLVAAAMALSWPARAGDPAPGTAWVGVQAGISGGASFARPQAAVNNELARAGWPTLPPASPALYLYFGIIAYDASINMRFGGSDASVPGYPGSEDGRSYYRNEIMVDFGYRLWVGRALSLTPLVSVGSLWSILCFEGRPDATSWTSRPAFEQVLRNPGRGACLESASVGLGVGLTFAWNRRFTFEQAGTSSLAGDLSIGPRVGYTLALSSGRTWEQGASSELGAEIPPFEGPLGPLGGAYAGLELQFRFVVEGR